MPLLARIGIFTPASLCSLSQCRTNGKISGPENPPPPRWFNGEVVLPKHFFWIQLGRSCQEMVLEQEIKEKIFCCSISFNNWLDVKIFIFAPICMPIFFNGCNCSASLRISLISSFVPCSVLGQE